MLTRSAPSLPLAEESIKMASAHPAKKPVQLGYEEETKGDADLNRVRDFSDVAVLPEEGDNCAICRAVTPAGTVIRAPGKPDIVLDHTILEGHRFAITSIQPGEKLLSWGLTFGIALRAMSPGNYLANERVIKALRARGLTDLPETPNFEDIIVPHLIDEAAFQPAEQVPLVLDVDSKTWMGYKRHESRGVGTRNYIILVCATSLGSGYVKALEARVKELSLAAGLANIDGVVAVAHTEGGGPRDGPKPHNFDLVCRTLTSFMVHPNVAAALVVDYGSDNESIWNDDLQAYARAHPEHAPLQHVPHAFVRLSGDLEQDLSRGVSLVESWLPAANACVREPAPYTALSIAQQCGGSDAFSGVSGNPCAGEACMLLIAHGGQAVLAETDELMGAESYILEKVKDLPTAKKFMGIINGFKERLAWHGQSAESNPSGGNNYRGLYNIGLKSLGAAKKKHAQVRLDDVLQYAERSTHYGRGYYMMDSPGNDLESIAGQVATGCNLIYFITGNGSITNFPFVPTIKIVTTTTRFQLLQKDMDFNAGRYQEGTPMPVLGQELFDLTVQVVNGSYSVGEKAGHAQVSLWRNWPQGGPTDVTQFNHGPKGGKALTTGGSAVSTADAATFKGYRVPVPGAPVGSARPYLATERMGLILPTSLCSGEVARKITTKLNAAIQDPSHPLSKRVSRFECLPHTEGCGTGYAEGGMEMYQRVMLGHLTHPSVGLALCLEHGCEKTHNDFFHGAMESAGIPTDAYGYASIQLDGGIDSVTGKVTEYFTSKAAAVDTAEAEALAQAANLLEARESLALHSLDVGLLVTDRAAAENTEIALLSAMLARTFATRNAASGTPGAVVLPCTSPLLRNRVFAGELSLSVDTDCECPVEPTLAFGQRVRPLGPKVTPEEIANAGGFHVMDMPSVRDWNETVTGLVGTGVQAIITLSTAPKKGVARVAPGHPMVPVIHLGCAHQGQEVDPAWAATTDAILSAPAGVSGTHELASAWLAQAVAVVSEVVTGTRKAKSTKTVFFSITRGPTGVST